MVITIESIQLNEVLALVLSATSTTLLVVAKKTLGRHHTWVGYHLDESTIIKHGIYSRIRHPIYTSSMIFIISSFFLIKDRMDGYPNWLVIMIFAILSCIAIFIIYLAMLESREMKMKYGKEFDKYKAQVRAFIPFNKTLKVNS
jgi:protein-S-isoprenylcysteine O-methyltransferase Ste14